MASPDVTEYHRIGLMTTCVSKEHFAVAGNGVVYYAVNRWECEEGQLWHDDWHLLGTFDAATLDYV